MSISLAALFSDHMVFQRDIALPVWGWAEADEAVAVALAGNTASATAGPDGRWLATLPALPAGGPYTLTATGLSTTVTVQDVLVGEVWVCSGQSNMEWPLSLVNNADEEVTAAQHAGIRLFQVPQLAVVEPPKDVVGAWSECTPETAANFSAVGYFFGRELHQRLGVPVGLINTSWGGTIAEAWTSRAGLLAEPILVNMVEEYERNLQNFDETMAAHQQLVAAWEASGQGVPKDPGNSGYAHGWADPATDTAAWQTIDLPRPWQSVGLNFSGVLWFRRTVEIPAEWAGKELTLSIGACDKSDVTYFNNVQVGGISIDEHEDAWRIPRIYPIPGELVHAGKNVIAVRVFSNMYGGGMTGAKTLMHVAPADESGTPIPLHGQWQYEVEHNFGFIEGTMPQQPQGPGNPNSPWILNSGMLVPLQPFAICGAIWYQGESNADRAYQYRTLFPAMIRDWRRQWAQGDFTFLFAQLANYTPEAANPGESQWAELREAQTMTLAEPNTGMAVIIDIGEAEDIHPRNKQDVGLRLALNALALSYGQTHIIYSGPSYRSMQVEGAAIRLAFDHLGGGLMSKDDKPLTAFAIAGADRKFVWADAVIAGDTIVVSSPTVTAPVAVRYGWAENPACNLYNQANLPASPFRTDNWPISKEIEGK